MMLSLGVKAGAELDEDYTQESQYPPFTEQDIAGYRQNVHRQISGPETFE
jgi:hypothetical protein